MKPKTSLFACALALVFCTVALENRAQTADPVFDKIAKRIKAGDADGLSLYFDASVELTVPGTDGVRASKQAQFVIKEFFTKYPPGRFAILHKGNSGSTHYATATYTSGETIFDTNIFVKSEAGKFVITQIRFEEE